MMAAAVSVLLGTVAAGAQTNPQSEMPPERGSIGLPLPRIGLPHPPMGLPLETSPTRRNGNEEPRRERPRLAAPVYPWPYGWVVVESARGAAAGPVAPSPQSAAPDPISPPARLRVIVEPRVEQQVYVDGYYVGDFDAAREGFPIADGAHSLEVRAEGYDPLEVPIQLEAGRPTAFRGRLQPASETTGGGREVSAAAGAPMTFYAIPGCYIGNVPPQDAGLPASCDLSKTITVRR